MAFKDTILKAVGAFVKDGADAIGQFKFTKEEQAEFQLKQAELANKLTIDLMDAANKQEQMFNERTIALEGTAGDLKSVPFVGPILIFLRGAFRPLFAYLVAYFDWAYFISGMTWTDKQESLLYAVNLLVLAFFFGERAIKNVMPVITQMFAAKNGK